MTSIGTDVISIANGVFLADNDVRNIRRAVRLLYLAFRLGSDEAGLELAQLPKRLEVRNPISTLERFNILNSAHRRGDSHAGLHIIDMYLDGELEGELFPQVQIILNQCVDAGSPRAREIAQSYPDIFGSYHKL